MLHGHADGVEEHENDDEPVEFLRFHGFSYPVPESFLGQPELLARSLFFCRGGPRKPWKTSKSIVSAIISIDSLSILAIFPPLLFLSKVISPMKFIRVLSCYSVVTRKLFLDNFAIRQIIFPEATLHWRKFTDTIPLYIPRYRAPIRNFLPLHLFLSLITIFARKFFVSLIFLSSLFFFSFFSIEKVNQHTHTHIYII